VREDRRVEDEGLVQDARRMTGSLKSLRAAARDRRQIGKPPIQHLLSAARPGACVPTLERARQLTGGRAERDDEDERGESHVNDREIIIPVWQAQAHPHTRVGVLRHAGRDPG